MKLSFQRVIGFLLIVLGVLPWVVKIPAVAGIIGNVAWLTALIYQIVIVFVGILLITDKRIY